MSVAERGSMALVMLVTLWLASAAGPAFGGMTTAWVLWLLLAALAGWHLSNATGSDAAARRQAPNEAPWQRLCVADHPTAAQRTVTRDEAVQAMPAQHIETDFF